MTERKIWEYARDSDLEGVKKRVELKGKDIINTEKDSYKYTALIWASRKGDLPIIQYLISNGANINDRNNVGDTVLIWAAYNGHLPIVQYLINNGANVNDKNNNGETALYWACNPNTTVSDSTAVELIQILIANGADETIRNNGNKSPAEFAKNTTLRNALNQAIQAIQYQVLQSFESENSSSPIISMEELLNCPQCRSLYTDPRLLPCEHTLCLTCVENVQHSKELKDRVCPIDKTPFPVNLKPADLPQNHLCATLATILSKATLNTFVPKSCVNCSNIPASLWCGNCGDLCEACSKAIHSMGAFKSHKIVTLQEKKQVTIVPKCSTHENKDTDLYCSQCKVLICYICEKTSHSTHKCILVSDAAKSSKDALKSTLVSFLRKRSTLQKLIAKKREETKTDEARKTQLLVEIETIEARIKERNKEIETTIQQFNQSETIFTTLMKMIEDKSNFDILDQKVFEETKSLVGSLYRSFYKEDMIYKN